MKRYFLIFVVLVNYPYTMEPMEKALAQSNDRKCSSLSAMPIELACSYLEEAQIDLKGKFILDIGSKTGEISYIMAQQAKIVMGIEPDEDIINKAKQYHSNQENLFFYQSSPEKYQPLAHSSPFHVATIFNFFDFIKDKHEACKSIHRCLYQKGEILVNVGSGKEPFDFHVTRAMVESFPLMKWVPGYYKLEKSLAEAYLTEEDYKKIFKESGFDIITCTKKIGTCLFKNEQEFVAMKRPIVMSNAVMRSLPTKISEWIFNCFIAQFLKMLEKNSEGHYIYPIEEILIHARKK